MKLTKEEKEKEEKLINKEIQYFSQFSKEDTIQYFSKVYPEVDLSDVILCFEKEGEERVQCYYDLLTYSDGSNHLFIMATILILTTIAMGSMVALECTS